MVIGHFGIGDNLSHSNHIELQVKTRLNFGSLDLASPSLPRYVDCPEEGPFCEQETVMEVGR